MPSDERDRTPAEVMAGLFVGKTLEERRALLAALERGGAALYREMASGKRDPRARAELEAAAQREEENARLLEGFESSPR